MATVPHWYVYEVVLLPWLLYISQWYECCYHGYCSYPNGMKYCYHGYCTHCRLSMNSPFICFLFCQTSTGICMSNVPPATFVSTHITYTTPHHNRAEYNGRPSDILPFNFVPWPIVYYYGLSFSIFLSTRLLQML